MTLTYIFHSGFVVGSEKSAIIFDYFKDSEDGFVHRLLDSFDGAIYVLASHWHPDHFNSEILQWRSQRPDIKYILSRDILKKRYAAASDATFLKKGECFEDENIKVQAFGSTDVGVSFLLATESKLIFHAGDLNFWHWKDESTAEEVRQSELAFLNEVDTIRQTVERVDVAMFPVDARLGNDYMLGAEMFIERIHCELFAPMHFTSAYDKANAFRRYAESKGCRFAAWSKKGQSIDF
ncbi:MAG: MBL fold metallo-hydrolase [Tannerella sp.]|jgi:L-ascorbate metabolism protein UlaG (beta-lactamase superfamily)|nr:MBL fold metallo-hydrolase [Tannerella sp.]